MLCETESIFSGKKSSPYHKKDKKNIIIALFIYFFRDRDREEKYVPFTVSIVRCDFVQLWRYISIDVPCDTDASINYQVQ